nr:dual specificity protein kinase CLK1-like [Pocillopora verrucosa]
MPCYPVPLLAGRYKFIQVIVKGESSLLISAEDTYHFEKKQVAIKIMNLDYSRLGAQEADCIQQLNKADPLRVSRAVQLFNVFSFEGHYCLVFELLRPQPLHQCFQRNVSLITRMKN